MTVKIIFIFLKEESNIMITWNNLDTLASFKELEKVERVNLVEAMTGESGAERVKNYSVPMAEGLTYNYAAKQVDDKLLAALAKLERNEEAYHLLNDGDGIDVSDIREGDSDIQSIWESLHEKVYGEKGHLPHYYNFKVN